MDLLQHSKDQDIAISSEEPPPHPPEEEFNNLVDETEEFHIPVDETKDTEEKNEDKNEDKATKINPQFLAFQKVFEEQINSESKLELAINFMEECLTHGSTPQFRNFWEARRYCLPLFKETIAPAVRSKLWSKYSDLSKEAKRLKEIFDEQSAFAVEQIDIAIKALLVELEHADEQIKKANLSETFNIPPSLSHSKQLYYELQVQLNILKTQAARINALRKELLKTEMRIRQKNKFFQMLSSAGDKVFPKRKELIKQISGQFIEDIGRFIQTHFGKDAAIESLYIVREEIKALQSLARVLTLNTLAFSQTRAQLSECWDKIKLEEKERKKERAHQRVAFKQNGERESRKKYLP